MVSMVLVPTIGATLIGIFISTALYGVVCMQTCNYFQKFGSNDAWGLKSLVTFLWLLETTHAFLICSTMFRWVILDLDNPVALARTQLSDDVMLGITALIILTVQCFYARRLWLLSKKNILLVSVVITIAVCHFGLEMAAMVTKIKFPETNTFHKISRHYIGNLGFAAADDIIIAIAMVYLLKSRRTGVKSTNSMVTKIITWSISTGILTSVVEIVVLISYITMPNTFVYLAFFVFVNNLYVNSLLAVLNARGSLREMRPTVDVSNGIQLSDLHSKTSENTTVQDT